MYRLLQCKHVCQKYILDRHSIVLDIQQLHYKKIKNTSITHIQFSFSKYSSYEYKLKKGMNCMTFDMNIKTSFNDYFCKIPIFP